MRQPTPALLVVAAFSRHDNALAWGRERLEATLGPVVLSSPTYPFDQTTYYEAEMGGGLSKVLWAFGRLVDPASLPDIKLRAIEIEGELTGSGRHPEARPLNLDPGLLTLGKFVLATTKDQAHRVYLRDGILAEATLRYSAGRFYPWPWTYADYRLEVVNEALLQARAYYQDRLRGTT